MCAQCSCSGGTTLIFACSGASNCGQATNQAALKLRDEGVGSMYCLAGIGGNIQGMIQGAKDADLRIVLDGCPVKCAKKTFEQAGLTADIYVVATEAGVEKTHEPVKKKDVDKVVDDVMKKLMEGTKK